ncbi:MAG: aspartate kinase [Flavobacteriaceae bacterium]|nr:aspartate kinase [Flavobacteriaceae bacterium]|tara:strand:+ start:2680 stop:3339 length:660 start_codon:yes stop_codon:yes gene_type:complete
MKTISSVVENYIKNKPFLSTALSEGIINLTSLSRKIKPEIELVLKKQIRSGAIVMALKRISNSLEFVSTHKILKILKNIGDITVRSNLIDYSFKVSDSLLSCQAKFLSEIDNRQLFFYTSSRGVTESNIIISNEMKEKMETYFKKEILIKKTDNLSSISIKLPVENISIPGIYYFIFQKMSWEGINIIEVISTSNEFTIVVDDQNVNDAFKIIKNLKSL